MFECFQHTISKELPHFHFYGHKSSQSFDKLSGIAAALGLILILAHTCFLCCYRHTLTTEARSAVVDAAPGSVGGSVDDAAQTCAEPAGGTGV